MTQCEYVKRFDKEFPIVCDNISLQETPYCDECFLLVSINTKNVRNLLDYQRKKLEEYGIENHYLWARVYSLIDENQKLKQDIDHLDIGKYFEQNKND